MAPSLFKPHLGATRAKVLREVEKVKREGLLEKLQLEDEGSMSLKFKIEGASGTYSVVIDLEGWQRPVSCTCPANRLQGLCKHSMAAMLWCLPQTECAAALVEAAEAEGSGSGAQTATDALYPPVPAPDVTDQRVRAAGRNMRLEGVYMGGRRIPRSLLMHPGDDTPSEEANKPEVEKAAVAKPPAKRAKAEPPKPSLPKVYISGEAMMMGTDEELLAECRAAVAGAAAPGESPAALASPPTQPSCGLPNPSIQAMEVEKGGSADAAMTAAPPTPPAPPAAPTTAPELPKYSFLDLL